MNSPRRNIESWFAIIFLATALMTAPAPLQAQDAAPPSDYVSRAEYDKLKAEHEAMKQALGKAVSEGKQVVTAPPEAAPEELRQEVETLKLQVKETFPGTTKFLRAGYGTAGFTARSGEDP